MYNQHVEDQHHSSTSQQLGFLEGCDLGHMPLPIPTTVYTIMVLSIKLLPNNQTSI